VQQRFSQDVLAKNDAVQLNKHSVKSQCKKKQTYTNQRFIHI